MTSTDSPSIGFWRGYALWLRPRRRGLLALALLTAVAWTVLVWFAAAPQDAFDYAVF